MMTVATGLPANTAKEAPLLKLRRWVIRPEDAHGGCHSRRRNEKPRYLKALPLSFWQLLWQLQVGREAVSASRTAVSARCAYRAVVWGWVWPSSLPTTCRDSPLETRCEANVCLLCRSRHNRHTFAVHQLSTWIKPLSEMIRGLASGYFSLARSRIISMSASFIDSRKSQCSKKRLHPSSTLHK